MTIAAPSPRLFASSPPSTPVAQPSTWTRRAQRQPVSQVTVEEMLGESPITKQLRLLVEVLSEPAPVDKVQAPVVKRIESSCIILFRQGLDGGSELYLQRRIGAWRAGFWATPAGHVDPDDVDPLQAAQRELREETGLDLPRSSFNKVFVCHTDADVDDRDPSEHRIDHYYVVETFGGEPVIAEPHRADKNGWFKLSDLKQIPMVGKVRASLCAMAHGREELHLTSQELEILWQEESLRKLDASLVPHSLSAGVEPPTRSFRETVTKCQRAKGSLHEVGEMRESLSPPVSPPVVSPCLDSTSLNIQSLSLG